MWGTAGGTTRRDFGVMCLTGWTCYLPAFWGVCNCVHRLSPGQIHHPLSSLLLPGFGSWEYSSLSPYGAAKPPELLKTGIDYYLEILIQKNWNVKWLSISSEALWDFHFLSLKWHVIQSVISAAWSPYFLCAAPAWFDCGGLSDAKIPGRADRIKALLL